MGHLLAHAGLDPTVIVGGKLLALGGTAMLGRGEYLVLLNNDTYVTDGWLGRMMTVMDEHPEVVAQQRQRIEAVFLPCFLINAGGFFPFLLITAFVAFKTCNKFFLCGY